VLTAEPSVQATIFAQVDARLNRSRLYLEILHRARDAGLGGATVLAGIEGFGDSGVLHTDRILDLGDGLPVVVILIDSGPRLRRFVEEIADVAGGLTVTFKEVTVLRGDPREDARTRRDP